MGRIVTRLAVVEAIVTAIHGAGTAVIETIINMGVVAILHAIVIRTAILRMALLLMMKVVALHAQIIWMRKDRWRHHVVHLCGGHTFARTPRLLLLGGVWAVWAGAVEVKSAWALIRKICHN